jgi:predicted GNAT superfamily acetyltransferase
MAHRKKAKRSAVPQPPPEVVVRHCHGLEDLATCVEIQRTVWGSSDADLTPLPLFVVGAETGGQVLGAFVEDRMVGFTFALAGFHGKTPFLHSHMTAVLDGWRDRGVGRSLKIFQRDDALSRGIGLIEWSFDPLQVKNAYFNLVRLGAIARRFVANMYGAFSSPLQGKLPTDRLIAEWHLGSMRVRRAVSAQAASAPATRKKGARGGKQVRIRIPAELAAARQTRPDEALRMQAEIRQEFEYWLKLGHAATSIEVSGTGGEYLLEPWAKG